MKAIFFAVVVIGAAIYIEAALTDEQKQKVVGYGKDCIASTGVDKELVTKARQGDFTDDQKLKDFSLCLSKKLNFQNEKGEVNTDVIKQKLGAAIDNEAAADELVKKCITKKDAPEQVSFDAFKCYYDSTPTHISFF